MNHVERNLSHCTILESCNGITDLLALLVQLSFRGRLHEAGWPGYPG